MLGIYGLPLQCKGKEVIGIRPPAGAYGSSLLSRDGQRINVKRAAQFQQPARIWAIVQPVGEAALQLLPAAEIVNHRLNGQPDGAALWHGLECAQ